MLFSKIVQYHPLNITVTKRKLNNHSKQPNESGTWVVVFKLHV